MKQPSDNFTKFVTLLIGQHECGVIVRPVVSGSEAPSHEAALAGLAEARVWRHRGQIQAALLLGYMASRAQVRGLKVRRWGLGFGVWGLGVGVGVGSTMGLTKLATDPDVSGPFAEGFTRADPNLILNPHFNTDPEPNPHPSADPEPNPPHSLWAV